MLVSKDFKQQALQALKGNWGIAVLTGLIATILGAATDGGGNSGSVGSRLTDQDTREALPSYFGVHFETVVTVVIFAMTIWFIVSIIIGGAITLGYVRFNLNLIDRTGASFGDLFSEFDRFGDGFFMQILIRVYTFLWTLLLIIPGIIASYSYAMTPYILLEHPELSANQAIKASKELMSGNRWRLFCLEFSFIGWTILSTLTLGIGFLWLIPYMEASKAAFYRDLVKEQETASEYL